MKRPSILFVMPFLLAAACATACGGAGGEAGGKAAPSGPAASTDAKDANARYAKCLREHGVDMPDDPKRIPQGGIDIPDKAAAACKGLAPRGETIDMNDPVVRDRFARFARCMRANGFDMPDNAPPDIHLKDPPKWEKASKVCSHILREGRESQGGREGQE